MSDRCGVYTLKGVKVWLFDAGLDGDTLCDVTWLLPLTLTGRQQPEREQPGPE